MDNVQDTAIAPLGQAEPVAQAPEVKSEVPASVEPTAVAVEPTQPSDETSYETVAAQKGFKSPDDLAKAYVNSQRLATKASMKAAELEKQFFPDQKVEVQAPMRQIPQPAEEEKAIQELDRFVNERTQKAKAEAEQFFKTELAKIELRSVIKDKPDFANYANEIKDLKSRYPGMSFEEAYTFAKAVNGASVQEARTDGMKQGAAYLQKQSAAQVLPAKPVSEDKIPTSDLIKGSGSRLAVRQGDSAAVIQKKMQERQLIEQQLLSRMENDRDAMAFNRF